MNWFDTRVKRARSLLAHYNIARSKCFLLLDAGCGDGVQSRAFLSYFPRCKVIAIDIREYNIIESIRHNKQFKGRFQAVIGDYHELPFQDDSFDYVLLGFSLHESNDKITALQEAYRVLKPLGNILIVDYQLDAPTYWIPPSMKIAPHELLHLIKQHLPMARARVIHSTRRIHVVQVTKQTTRKTLNKTT